MTFILAVDVGNTRAKFGLFRSSGTQVPQVMHVSASRLTADQDVSTVLQEWITEGLYEPDYCIVAGSNPPARDELLSRWPQSCPEPVVVDSNSQVPVSLDVERPESVGVDRLLTAYASGRLFGGSQPIVVVDAGTATTVNLMTSDGVFRGGAILPGMRLSAYALHDYTARLPLIDADRLFPSENPEPDAPLPGRNTVDAMKSGLFWGQLGAIRELVNQLADIARTRFGDKQPRLLVVTGGGGRQVVSQLTDAVYIDCLALHGLAALTDSESSNF